MAISPARPRITTAAQHIHAANTGQEGAKLEPPTCHVFRKLLQDIQLRYIESPARDGKTLLSLSDDGVVQRWDVGTGKVQATLDVPKTFTGRGCFPSPD